MEAPRRPISAYAFVSLGFEFLGALALTGFAGFAADQYLNSRPWFLITGVFLGFGAGLWHIVRRATMIQAAMDEQEREPSSAEESTSDRQRIDRAAADLKRTEHDLDQGLKEIESRLADLRRRRFAPDDEK